MTHATFGRIPVAVDTERAFLEAQQERFLAAAEAARAAGGKHTTVKAHRDVPPPAWNTRLVGAASTPPTTPTTSPSSSSASTTCSSTRPTPSRGCRS